MLLKPTNARQFFHRRSHFKHLLPGCGLLRLVRLHERLHGRLLVASVAAQHQAADNPGSWRPHHPILTLSILRSAVQMSFNSSKGTS